MNGRKFIALVGGVAAVLASVGATLAQASAVKSTKPAPPVRSGPGSLTGVWNTSAVGSLHALKTDSGDNIPLRPWAAKLAAERLRALEDGKPAANNSSQCRTEGMPQVMAPGPELPIQFIETSKQVTVLFDAMDTFRIIHLNEKHPADPDPAIMGNSIGHWQGDTLIVDTIAVSEKTSVRGVIPHGENLHIVERIRRTGPDTLEDRMTLDDPNAFTKPWAMVIPLKRIVGMRIKEHVCANARQVPNPVMPPSSS